MNCDYTSCIVFVGHHLEASFFDHGGELSLLWEFPNAFDKILIRVLVIGQESSHNRNGVKAIIVVDLFEAGNYDV